MPSHASHPSKTAYPCGFRHDAFAFLMRHATRHCRLRVRKNPTAQFSYSGTVVIDRKYFSEFVGEWHLNTRVRRTYGRNVSFLSHVFDNRTARHSAVRHKCRTLRKHRSASRLNEIYRRGSGRSIPRRRRLSLSENGNPFVRFADISPIRGISRCHFVTSPQRGAPLPYGKRFREFVGERLAAPVTFHLHECMCEAKDILLLDLRI